MPSLVAALNVNDVPTELRVRINPPAWMGPTTAPRTRAQLQRSAAMSLGWFLITLLLSLVALAAIVIEHQFRFLMSLALLALLAVTTFRVWRIKQRRLSFTEGSPIPFLPEFAFTVTDDNVYFPGSLAGPEEVWPLDDTELEVIEHDTPNLSASFLPSAYLRRIATDSRRLKLTCPGHEPRYFAASLLYESPDAVLKRVEAFRNGEAVAADPIKPGDPRYDAQGRYLAWFSHSLLYEETVPSLDFTRMMLWLGLWVSGFLSLLAISLLVGTFFVNDEERLSMLLPGLALTGFLGAIALFLRYQLNQMHPAEVIRSGRAENRWAFRVDDDSITVRHRDGRTTSTIPLTEAQFSCREGRWQLLRRRKARRELVISDGHGAIFRWPKWQLNEPLEAVLAELTRRGVSTSATH